MLVVGGGLVGLAVAWELLNQGLAVELIDPALDQASTSDPASGSLAALGVLMAQVFHRSSGRGWRLREQSQLLWQQWLIRLRERGHRVTRRDGQLAPRAVRSALWCEARAAGLSTCRDTVTALERRGSDWQVHCQSGSS
ncbi:MAG: FAD-dependent oxidoreductase, partial [Cyanobium sp.]